MTDNKSTRFTLAPDQLNYLNAPKENHGFVDYFLNSDDGVASILSLSETKLEYEKKCRAIIVKMTGPNKTRTQEFFKTVLDAIQVKFPDSNNTAISEYHIEQALAPIITAMQLQKQAKDELDSLCKYHTYILSVVTYIENRMKDKQVIDPDALVEVETRLLAGIMIRSYHLFVKMKDAVKILSSKKSAVVSSEELIVQLKKLILAIYTEIACIYVTFNNTLTSLSQLNAGALEKYRKQMAVRKTQARHAVIWAARSIDTALLHYYVKNTLGIAAPKSKS